MTKPTGPSDFKNFITEFKEEAHAFAGKAEEWIKDFSLTSINFRPPEMPHQVSKAGSVIHEKLSGLATWFFGGDKVSDKDREFITGLLEKVDPKEEGVFRLSGNRSTINRLLGEKKVPDTVDTHDVTGVCKEWLEKNPIFPEDKLFQILQEKGFIEHPKTTGVETEEKTQEPAPFDWVLKKDVSPKDIYDALIKGLSPNEQKIFRALLQKCCDAYKERGTSKMTLDNLAIVLGKLFPRSIAPSKQLEIQGQSSVYNNLISSVLGKLFVHIAPSEESVEQSNETSETAPVEEIEESAPPQVKQEGKIFADQDLERRIESLEKKEGNPLERIAPEKIYEALTQGLSAEDKKMFDDTIASLRIMKKPIGIDRTLSTPLGLSKDYSGGRVEAFTVNKILINKLLQLPESA